MAEQEHPLAAHKISPAEALARRWQRKNYEKSGLMGVGKDVVQGVMDAPSAFGNMLKETPKEIRGALRQFNGEDPNRSILTDFDINNSLGSDSLKKEYEGPGRFLQNAAAGVPRFGNRLLNAGLNAANYAQRRGFVDEGSTTDKIINKLNEFRKPRNNGHWYDDFYLPGADYDYATAFGKEGHKPGDELIQNLVTAMIGGSLGSVGGGIGSLLGATAIEPLGQDRNPIPDIAGGFAIHQGIKKLTGKPSISGDKLSPTEAPPSGGKSTGVMDKASNLYSNLKERFLPDAFRENASLEKSIGDLNKEKGSVQANILENQTNAGRIAGEELEKYNATQEKNVKDFESKIPTKEEGQSKTNLANVTKEWAKKTDKALHDRYNDFYASDAGQRQLVLPDVENIHENYRDVLIALPPDSLDFIQNALDDGIVSVEDAIQIRKTLRDTKSSFSKLSKGDILPAEKGEYHRLSKMAREFEKNINSVIEDALTPEELTKIKAIDTDWKNLHTPFEKKSFLRNAVKEHPDISNANFYDNFNTKGVTKLKTEMLKEPQFKDALARHDLKGLDITNLEKLNQVIKSEAFDAFPEDIQKMLQEQKTALEQKPLIESFKKEITAKEIISAINEPQMKKVFKNRPDLREPVENIKQEQARLKEIEKQLIEQGTKKAEAQKIVDNYKWAMRGALAVGGLGFIRKIVRGLF